MSPKSSSLETFESLPSTDPATEYGSDWDEDTLHELISSVTAGSESPFLVIDIEDYEAPQSVKLPKVLGKESRPLRAPRRNASQRAFSLPNQPLHESIRSQTAPDISANSSRSVIESRNDRALSADPGDGECTQADSRPPLERFRSPPKKPLSVTDLISPAWCELQYFYTLAKHGKKKRTPAMKQGTVIHKRLEDEVHTTHPVTVLTKEDGWGLRIWNTIQGIRTLRETGRTRELEIWGVVHGQFVNGIIDELSYTIPDPSSADKAAMIAPKAQSTIKDFFFQQAGGRDIAMALGGDGQDKPGPTSPNGLLDMTAEIIYVTDIKTRSANSLPDTSSSLPTQFQLFLYRHFLEQLATGQLPLETIASRHDLDVNAVFSDEFITEVGGLNEQYLDAVSVQESWDGSQPSASQNSLDMLLEHNTLSSLWQLLQSIFKDVLMASQTPAAGQENTRLSPILTATYLSNTTSEVIGHKTFLYDQSILDSYLQDGMKWWKGERPARGVDLSEVNRKCRWCDFRDSCEWLQEKDLANLRTAREKWREKADPSVV